MLIIGWYYPDSLVCLKCVELVHGAPDEGEPAYDEALPDGYTCAECGEVVGVA